MEVELIAITRYLHGDHSPTELIERAGRICYRSKSQGDPTRFIGARLRDGHESIVEHASATFEVHGISRACSHQLVRHRLASYSQESQRYVDMANPEFVVPDAIAEDPQARFVFDTAMRSIAKAYKALRDQGIRKEDARFVLPNATATSIIITMNFRELRHFFKLRCAPDAQWEIRRMALEMREIMRTEAPAVFGENLTNAQK